MLLGIFKHHACWRYPAWQIIFLWPTFKRSPHFTAAVSARGVEGVRVLVGIKAIAGKHRTEGIEEAVVSRCFTAHSRAIA